MTQNLYFEKTKDQDITFGIAGKAAFANKKQFKDMSGHTVIVVAEEYEDESVIRDMADTILVRGCKNVAFCGSASEEWQRIFAEQDREINGFGGSLGFEDFAMMWRFEDIECLFEVVENCWNEVLILCSSMALIRECRAILDEN